MEAVIGLLLMLLGVSHALPEFTKVPVNQIGVSGGVISFVCQATGNPKPRVSWMKKGKKTQNQRVEVIEFDEGATSVLRIQPLRAPRDESIYECVAENNEGNVSVSANLSIIREDLLPPGFPTIDMGPQLKVVEHNRTATMLCAASGNPDPEITWYKDFLPIDPSASNGRIKQLPSVRRVPPRFSIPPTNQEVMLGGSVNLTCVAVGSPMPFVKWMMGSEDLTKEDEMPIGRNVLEVTNVLKSADYSCVAMSSLGLIEATVQITVKALPKPPNLPIVTETTATSVTLTWDSGNLEPVSYYVIQYRAKSSNNDFQEVDGVATTHYSVGGLRPNSEYEFRVLAAKTFGRGLPSNPVEVHTSEQAPSSPPLHIQARMPNASTMLVQWEPPEEPNGRIRGYRVYYSSDLTTPLSAWQIQITEDSMTTISSLIPDITYGLRVQGFTSVGDGPLSDMVQVKTQQGAPVSSVLLVSECLSQGETRVSCSSEGGDSPQYSWTLDGHTLTDTQLLSGNNETNNITLKPDVSGQLVCSVRNHISSVSKEARKCLFINCTLTNGTNISEWVLEASDIQCNQPTTSKDTTVGVETYCDGRKNNGAQCYGAFGGTVVLQLMDSASEIFRYEWLKNKTLILRGGKNRAVFVLKTDRSSFTPTDGTFRINNLSRTDGGEYTLMISDSNGRTSEPQTLQLIIQAPVSSVLLVSECLSQGETRVSCSSEGGDSPQYSWTLDGHTLTDTQLLSGNNETNNITLKPDVSGQLVCSVRNHISSVSKEARKCLFINCTLTNGTNISEWVLEASDIQCIEPTTSKDTTVGVETYCDGRKNNGAQCYGALGGTVVLQLMDSASEIFRYEWLKNKTSILRGGKNRAVFILIPDRSSFTPTDGTFRINNLSRTDGGEYTLMISDSNGSISVPQTLQLIIQAPVSSVLLVSECLSQGETRVSCSSEGGDSPQYSWTLDGHTLTDTQLLSGNNETNNITLKPDVSGQLVCSVRNHISSVSKEARKCLFINCTLTNGTNISEWVLEASDIQCIEPTTSKDTTVGKETGIPVSIKPPTNISSSNQTVTSSSTDDQWYITNWPILAGVLSALIILLVVGVAVVSVHMKKQNNKPKEQEDDQELTYADVRIMQRQGRQTQQRAEVEVEYGQVKFSERPRQAVEPTADDCVYSQVRKGR
ncbi:LOW QUALITY PROTEIN: hemicentin-1-like [Dicentrarchus labrax]|uniref:LOW QUALITY PROTEIN: hemicentin-1-like n=1 Tax=Dicentrarchus labrax TaxID=13489 RepID=UPI0021F56729|nr:LOW QUALITY PROTEIN: hemicentin-1-like [Dicentrarchus labrax]